MVSSAASVSDALALIAKGQRFDVAIIEADEARRRATIDSAIRGVLGAEMPRLIALAPLGRREEDSRLFVASVTRPVRASKLFDALSDALVQEVPAAPTAGTAQAAPRLGEPHPLRVLVAEDNLVNQKVTVSMLERLGYRADLVANGLEAVEAVRRVPYDLLFMDLHIPELDGLGAMRQIRSEHAEVRRPRIVALTANALERTARNAWLRGWTTTSANRCSGIC